MSFRTPGPQDVTTNEPAIDMGAHVSTSAGVRVPVDASEPATGAATRIRHHRDQTPPPPNMVGVSLAFVLVHPFRTNYHAQLAMANQVFACCGVQFFVEFKYHADPEMNRIMLGEHLNIDPNWASNSAMMEISRAMASMHGRIKVFFVRETGGLAGYSIPRALDHLHGDLGERIFVSDMSRPDTLAHELGHVLLHRDADHHPDPNNLLADGPFAGRILSPSSRRAHLAKRPRAWRVELGCGPQFQSCRVQSGKGL